MAFIDIIAADATAVLRSGDAKMAAVLLRFFHERFGGFEDGEHAPYSDECTGLRTNYNGFTLSFGEKHLHYASDGRGGRWIVSNSDKSRLDKAAGHDKAVRKFLAPYAFLEGIQYAIECYQAALNSTSIRVGYLESKRRLAHDLLCDTVTHIQHEIHSSRERQEDLRRPALVAACREKAAAAAAFIDEPPPAPAATMSMAAARASMRGVSGVYFLWEGDRIDYVGRADCVSRRLGKSHHKAQPNHRVSVVPMSIPDSWRHENYYIWRYNPPLNGRQWGNKGAVA